MAVQQTKELYKALRGMLNQFEQNYGKPFDFGPYPYSSVLGGDVAKFIYYLAASDGNIGVSECDYINFITEYGMSQAQIIDMVKGSGVVGADKRREFEKTPFNSFVLCVALDKLLAAGGMSHDYIKLYVSLFTMLGNDIISIDGVTTQTELADLTRIIENMRYVAEKEVAENEEIYAVRMETLKKKSEEEAVPAEEPTEEAALAEEPVEEETVSTEEQVEEKSVAEPVLEDDPIAEKLVSMSVEEIVSNINDKEKKYDFNSSLELSIGENGSSYIALRLPCDVVTSTLSVSAKGDMIDVMFVGNCLCVACDTVVAKKNLFTGEETNNSVTAEVVAMINKSIATVSERNYRRCEENTELYSYIQSMLHMESAIDKVNQRLEEMNNTLRIRKNNDDINCVVDESGVVHSIEEIIWLLSL